MLRLKIFMLGRSTQTPMLEVLVPLDLGNHQGSNFGYVCSILAIYSSQLFHPYQKIHFSYFKIG